MSGRQANHENPALPIQIIGAVNPAVRIGEQTTARIITIEGDGESHTEVGKIDIDKIDRGWSHSKKTAPAKNDRGSRNFGSD